VVGTCNGDGDNTHTKESLEVIKKRQVQSYGGKSIKVIQTSKVVLRATETWHSLKKDEKRSAKSKNSKEEKQGSSRRHGR